MKILLLGKDGQVGWELQRSLSPLGDVVACGRGEADLEDGTRLCALCRELRPDVVVNAAAYTAVDKAETDEPRARRINTDAVGLLAREVKALGASLIHYSTDYVFDGSKAAPYLETDAPSPLNVYGRTKLEGEDAIRDSGCRHLILRTSWVFAARGGNFAKTMLRLSAERETLNVVADQIGAPTSAELIADVTALALYRLARETRLADGVFGTYHLASAGAVSWHEYARFVIAEAERLGFQARTGAGGILPIRSSEYPTSAIRPLNSCLDTTRLRTTFGLVLPPWQFHVQRMVAELVKERKQ